MSSPQELRTSWLKRRWFDFRNGHSTYLIFVIQFAQFVVVTYQLYISSTSAVSVFPTITHWVVFFTATYIPAAVISGHLHRQKQMGTDQAQQVDVNPLSYKSVITDGKESLYTYRLNRLGFDLQMKGMEINNQIAQTLNEHFGSKIPLWSVENFRQVEEFRKIAAALEKGEDVRKVEFREYEVN